MPLNTFCAACQLRKQLEQLDKCDAPEEKKQQYLQSALRLFADGRENNAPALLYRLDALYTQLLGPLPDLGAQKRLYDQMMLEQLPALRESIERAAANGGDPFAAALQLSIAANYIDFGALDAVQPQKLQQLLTDALCQPLSADELAAFAGEAARARQLIYLTDNCGEIAADRLVIEELQRRWPKLAVTVMVRGGPVVNDATLEDAQLVGMTQTARVVTSGCALAGTDPGLVSDEARALLQQADLILAKGQGNFETLCDSTLPVYFAFLCKCPWFTRRFGLAQFQPVFIARSRLQLRTI